MKKIVRLTESELTRIVKRVIKEQQTQVAPTNNLKNVFKKNRIINIYNKR